MDELEKFKTLQSDLATTNEKINNISGQRALLQQQFDEILKSNGVTTLEELETQTKDYGEKAELVAKEIEEYLQITKVQFEILDKVLSS